MAHIGMIRALCVDSGVCGESSDIGEGVTHLPNIAARLCYGVFFVCWDLLHNTGDGVAFYN